MRTALLISLLAACGHPSTAPLKVELVAPVSMSMRQGMPSFDAATDTDVFAALGALHAREQGARLIATRCMLRGCGGAPDASSLGLVERAERTLLRSTDEERRLLDAFARGVRSELGEGTWSPVDSVALASWWALEGGAGVGTERGAVAGRAMDLATVEQALQVDLGLTEMGWDTLRAGLPEQVAALESAPAPASVAPAAARGGEQPRFAAVASTGTLPAVAAHVVSPTFQLSGWMPAGVPLFVTGASEQVAWSFVAARADLIDVVLPSADAEPLLALRLPAGESHTFQAAWDLARAEGAVPGVRAFDRPVDGVWRIVLADAEGHLADALVGDVLLREGATPLVGRDPAGRWTGRRPRLLDPAGGLVFAAGERPQGPVGAVLSARYEPEEPVGWLQSDVLAAQDLDALVGAVRAPRVPDDIRRAALAGLAPSTPAGERCQATLSRWDGASPAGRAVWTAWRTAYAEQLVATWPEDEQRVWQAAKGPSPQPPVPYWTARPAVERSAALDTACAQATPAPGLPAALGVDWSTGEVRLFRPSS